LSIGQCSAAPDNGGGLLACPTGRRRFHFYVAHLVWHAAKGFGPLVRKWPYEAKCANFRPAFLGEARAFDIQHPAAHVQSETSGQAGSKGLGRS
jgi:hypothetical protein